MAAQMKVTDREIEIPAGHRRLSGILTIPPGQPVSLRSLTVVEAAD